MNTLHALRPFTIRPVILSGADQRRATFRSSLCNYLYTVRAAASVDQFGPTPDFSVRLDELQGTGRAAPRRGLVDALAGPRLWAEADRLAIASRPDQPVAWHAVGSLPAGLQMPDWRAIIETFTEDLLVSQGMIVDWAIHCRENAGEAAPAVLPHVHFLITARGWDPARKPGAVMKNFLRTHASHRRHAEEWYRLVEMPPAPGYELRAEPA